MRREEQRLKKKATVDKEHEDLKQFKLTKRKEKYLNTIMRKVEIDRAMDQRAVEFEKQVAYKIKNAEGMKQLQDLAKVDRIAKAGIKTDSFIVREGGKILKPIEGYVAVVEDPEQFKYVPYEFDSEKRNKEPE